MKKLFTHSLLLKPLMAACFLLSASMLFAQHNPFYEGLTLEQMMNMEMVTASQNREKLSEAPATAYIITAQDIAERGYTSLDEVLEDLPEVEIQHKSETRNGSIYSVRGLFGNDRFLILLDGVRINAMAGDGNAVGKNYNIFNAERIEVILGPASAIWGADAFAGVVNIIPKKTQNGTNGRLQTGFGNYTTTHNMGVISYKKNKLSVAADASYYYSKEPFFPKYYAKDFDWYTNQYSKGGGLLLFGDTVKSPVQPWAMPTSAYQLNARVGYGKFEVGYYRNSEAHSSSTSARPENSLYVGDARYITDISATYLRHIYTSTNEKFSLSSQAAYSTYLVTPQSLFRNVYTGFQAGYKYSSERDFSVREIATWQLSNNQLITAGFTFQQTNIIPSSTDLTNAYGSIPDNQQYYAGSRIPVNFNRFNQIDLGLFAQYQANLKNIAKLTLGGRYDYNSRYGNTFNPRVGITFPATDSRWKVKALYASAFKAPSPLATYATYGTFSGNVDAQGMPTDTANFWNIPNPALKPERLNTTEISASYRWNSISLSGNVYFNTVYNVISQYTAPNGTFQGYPVRFVRYSINQPDSLSFSSYGGTLRLNYVGNIGDIKLNSQLAYTFCDAINSENGDDDLHFTALHTVKFGLLLSYARFSIRPSVMYRSSTKSNAIVAGTKDEEVSSPAFTLVNLNMRYNIFHKNNKNGAVFLTVRNLLDTRYYNVASLVDNNYFTLTPQDPIRIIGGFSFDF